MFSEADQPQSTFLTDLDLDSTSHSTKDLGDGSDNLVSPSASVGKGRKQEIPQSQPMVEVSRVEDAARALSTLLELESQPLPSAVDIDQVMSIATKSVINTKVNGIKVMRREEKKVWNKYFDTQENKLVIQDAFYFIICDFFNDPQEQKSEEDTHPYLPSQKGSSSRNNSDVDVNMNNNSNKSSSTFSAFAGGDVYGNSEIGGLAMNHRSNRRMRNRGAGMGDNEENLKEEKKLLSILKIDDESSEMGMVGARKKRRHRQQVLSHKPNARPLRNKTRSLAPHAHRSRDRNRARRGSAGSDAGSDTKDDGNEHDKSGDTSLGNNDGSCEGRKIDSSMKREGDNGEMKGPKSRADMKDKNKNKNTNKRNNMENQDSSTHTTTTSNKNSSIDKNGHGRRRCNSSLSSSSLSHTDVTSHAYTRKRIKNVLKTRIATNFVRIFLTVAGVHKDLFLRHYYDGLAQSIYYSFTTAYPESNRVLSSPQFRSRLQHLCAHWTMGHMPNMMDTSHWKTLATKQRTDTQLLRALTRPIGGTVKRGTCKTCKTLGIQHYRLKGSASARRGGGSCHSHGGEGDDDFFDDYDQHEHGINTGADHEGDDNDTGDGNKDKGGGGKSADTNGDDSKNNSLSSFGSQNPGERFLRGKDNEILTSHMLRLRHHRFKVPIKVVRATTLMHHSELVRHFLEAQEYNKLTAHAVRIPITSPEIVESPVAVFLEEMKLVNEQCMHESSKLQGRFGTTRGELSRLMAKETKEFETATLLLAKEKRVAMKDSHDFAKTLVQEYQDNRYANLRQPSKSLALRRLGHYRTYKDEQLLGGIHMK